MGFPRAGSNPAADAIFLQGLLFFFFLLAGEQGNCVTSETKDNPQLQTTAFRLMKRADRRLCLLKQMTKSKTAKEGKQVSGRTKPFRNQRICVLILF